jgi:hypothetical protein
MIDGLLVAVIAIVAIAAAFAGIFLMFTTLNIAWLLLTVPLVAIVALGSV